MGDASTGPANHPVALAKPAVSGCLAVTTAWIAAGMAGCDDGLSVPHPLVATMQLTLEGRGALEIPFAVPAEEAVRITVAARDVDVRLTLLDGSGQTLASADAPNRRMGVETLLLQAQAPSSVRLRVTGNDHGAARGTVTVTAVILPARTAADRRRIEAARHDAQGCAHHSDPALGEAAAREFASAAALHARNRDAVSHGLALLHGAGVQFSGRSQPIEAAVLAARAAAVLPEDSMYGAYAWRLEGSALASAAAQAARPRDRQQLTARSRARLATAAERLLAQDLPYEAGYAISYRAVSYHEQGDAESAREDYQEALGLFRRAGDIPGQALVRQSLAQMAYEDGRLDDALREFDTALALIPREEQPENYAHTLHNSALPLQVLGRFEEAIVRFHEARGLLQGLGDKSGEARALHGIGTALRHAGEPERARELLRAAIDLRAGIGAAREQSVTLTTLGDIERDLGNAESAIGLHREAATLVTAPGDRARALLSLAQAYMTAGRHGEARRELEAVVALDLPPTHRHVAIAWMELGAVRAAGGEQHTARAAFDTAVAAHRAGGSELELARALFKRAQARRDWHETDGVLDDTAEALDLFDRVGLLGTQAERRAVFLAVQRGVAELRIATLLDVAADARIRGQSAKSDRFRSQALATSDRVRARLLDMAGLHAPDRALGSAERGARHAALYEQLAGKRARRDRLFEAARQDEAQLARLATEIALLRTEIGVLEQGEFISGPLVRPAGLEMALSVPPGVVLAEYFLGEARGWIFVARHDGLQVVELPPRADIEVVARQLSAAWRAPPTGAGLPRWDAADRLARLTLEPLRPFDDVHTLWLVPDGALHVVPLTAIVDRALPDAAGVTVNIAPALRTVIGAAGPPRSPARELAVIADPIFDRDDPRLVEIIGPSGASTPPEPVRLAALADVPLTRSGHRFDRIERLPATAVEAREIMALAGGPGTRGNLALTGTAATVDGLRAAPLADFRILHLATHAWADSEDIALSALALSRWDDRGVPKDGAWRFVDIAHLRLGAELVVLSACETALGREIAGEGPVGLAQAFLRAGAGTVLATLWRVPDNATAELMREFYASFLRDREHPALALRRAQAKIRQQPKWRDPYYWAGFQLVSVNGAPGVTGITE